MDAAHEIVSVFCMPVLCRPFESWMAGSSLFASAAHKLLLSTRARSVLPRTPSRGTGSLRYPLALLFIHHGQSRPWPN